MGVRALSCLLILAGCGEPQAPGFDGSGLAVDYAIVVPTRLRFDVAIAIEDSFAREDGVPEWLSRSVEALRDDCTSFDLQLGVRPRNPSPVRDGMRWLPRVRRHTAR
jgi:hypothetical protein